MDTLQRQKLDAMKELAYGASHEINNPLANIATRAQTLLRDEAHLERRRALEAIYRQAMRAHEMISDLMLFARPPRLEIEPFDLCNMVESLVDGLADECQRRNIRLAVDTPAPMELSGDRQQLHVAVKAIVENAIEAIGQDGAVGISLRQVASPATGQSVKIEMTDSGPGISAEARPHLFDPFYSGREAGRGLGFGLSKCWRIVTDHGGTVEVESGAESGATFVIELPVGGPEEG
ncbi:MAG: HAMP domain-containing histidine kinase [Planctomycetes bacterium]|nr:HAMP domain-containing histidine kinase [Planctomycetota bacterium]